MRGGWRERLAVVLLAAGSLGLRLGFAPWTDFSQDEREIYAAARDFTRTGVLPVTGSSVSQSGTRLPGSLLPLLVGVPIGLAGGSPLGAARAAAAWNFAAVVLLYRLYRGLFPGLPAAALAAFLFYAPWTIVYTSIWNPSWLPVFSALFFTGLVRLFRRPDDRAGAFLLGFAPVMALQLHLSFVLLPALAGTLLALRALRVPRPVPLLAGAAAGAVTLVPYLLAPPPAANAAGGFLLPNVVLHPRHLLELPAILVRFLSFATGETFRVYANDEVAVLAALIRSHAWLALPGLAALAGSLWLYWQGARFYADGRRWGLLRTVRSGSLLERLDVLALITPLVATLLFLFSLRRPAAQALWILMPLSFYPILRRIAQTARSRRPALVALYIACAAAFSVLAYAWSPHPSHLRDAPDIASPAPGQR